LFDDELSALVKHYGLAYLTKEEDHSITFGIQGLHCCSYRLFLTDKDIAELSLFRRTKFNEEENTQLENTITPLVYPLRNAILYKQAVEKAYRDPLACVNYRAALDNALDQEIDLAKRLKTPLSMIMLYLEKFKRVNDT
jgi:GGDEF domain-containing protein